MMNATQTTAAPMPSTRISNALSPYKALLLELRSYGLNPSHWRLDSNQSTRSNRLNHRRVALENRYDSTFKLNGRLKYLRSGAWKLEGLELASI